MAIDYTNWPSTTQVFNLLTSAGISPTLLPTDDLAQLRIDSAVQTLQQQTQRQFITTTETRNFDGSGNGLMEVDEHISGSITQIYLYTLPQYSTYNLAGEIDVQRAGFPCTQIQILQGPANVLYGWFTYWPQGRSNVAITGTWGYGSSIPADVWQGVLYQAAAEIFDANVMNLRGIYDTIKDDDVTYTYSKDPASDVAEWKSEFQRVCKAYRRPLRSTLRRNEVTLI